ncbi:hypothetical protein [Streptomyces sp. NPDC058739]|uniref:hypothetical protein n=1 Tax=Streptomyces sp. NPDC058739 TaxID=3346618 RepID=UPI003682FD22
MATTGAAALAEMMCCSPLGCRAGPGRAAAGREQLEEFQDRPCGGYETGAYAAVRRAARSAPGRAADRHPMGGTGATGTPVVSV